jgi:hypothetical protein
MLISWEPKFKRTVLEIGDVDATHGGFRTEVHTRDLRAELGQQASSHEYHEDVDLNIDQNRLTPWKSWLDESGFDDLWNGGSQ